MSGGCRARPKAGDSRSPPVGVRGFKSHPPHHAHLINQYHDFLKLIKLKDISDKEKKRYATAVDNFLAELSYTLNDEKVISYINRLKSRYAPSTARKRIIYIRAFLKHINHPLADKIEIPKVPKKRKVVIKPEHVKDVIQEKGF